MRSFYVDFACVMSDEFDFDWFDSVCDHFMEDATVHDQSPHVDVEAREVHFVAAARADEPTGAVALVKEAALEAVRAVGGNSVSASWESVQDY
ncbi:hypothetical protein [Actinoalloteichus spitiensis]|uniref:hypothetical protein n=1 Tax=Actinoalloteichus spitiensis TaxID=252394 RepID=UPI00036D4AFC|nr:hypothetical protein [Actinoalloteichus spitiensis]